MGKCSSILSCHHVTKEIQAWQVLHRAAPKGEAIRKTGYGRSRPYGTVTFETRYCLILT